ncbi:hypothetical protein SAMN05880545_1593 [Microbacterium sp. RU33B]|nr:hypothetical protein SAMN05880545_1593 [Microbacterium sp. RU33B]
MARRSDGMAQSAGPDEWEWDDFATGDFESGEDDRA